MEFWKNFCPLHSDTVAVNALESISYFQGNCSIDNYLDEFTDLIMDAGYTDLKTIVVKFWRGLNPQIQDAIATMAYVCPSNTSPDSWYEVAKNIDQNHTANEAFKSACQPPIPIIPHHALPTLAPISSLLVHKSIDCPSKIDIRTMTAQELQKELTEIKDTMQKEVPAQSKTAKMGKGLA